MVFQSLEELFVLVGLTRDEIIAQSMLFFPAGYDTTATTISFLLYNLALHPEIQEKVHEEVVKVARDEV